MSRSSDQFIDSAAYEAWLHEQLEPGMPVSRGNAKRFSELSGRGIFEKSKAMDKIKEENPAKFFEQMEYDKRTVQDNDADNERLIKKHKL